MREAPDFDQAAAEETAPQAPSEYMPQRCFRCGSDENEVPILPVRYRGESTWVCTRCLPPLIHG